eukprot:gnl/TRDRNA2_/TRDRNA2_69628_c0_seq1.p1 gnl/TRDRNA2_/TRDRNA2_69628_c0~~gnl/TRDRNA2_/TRDRNA2_69628_c0_seq1.p1  ORF type:complete len:440 (+),score=49.53 gnl/TRDRNA2_/TRDRNA2_69628_c0_seq1:56-1375(+)
MAMRIVAWLLASFGIALGSIRLREERDAEESGTWQSWLQDFGHDTYRYPEWIRAQKEACSCRGEPIACHEAGVAVDWHSSTSLTYCVALQYSLEQMPSFDKAFLPPAVSMDGTSMLDDNIAFALMAWQASPVRPRPPLPVVLSYLLPYADYHESRANWRPLFFAKLFSLVADASTAESTVQALIDQGNTYVNWTAHSWPSSDKGGGVDARWTLQWGSSTAPPVLAPFDFVAYGYGSCTAWATYLTAALRAVGVPARQAGSPCWNSGNFSGLATSNPNVSSCWHGGRPNGPFGGVFLNNHNWVEYWDANRGGWTFIDVPPTTVNDTSWWCGTFDPAKGCSCGSKAASAGRDHDILAPTWTPVLHPWSDELEGGPVLDVARDLVLSTGEHVSPLVWASRLTSAIGTPLAMQLRVVNRTDFYRARACSGPAPAPPVLVELVF